MSNKAMLGVITDVVDMARITLPDNLQRQQVDSGDIIALSESIRSIGLIHPISVIPEGDNYLLIAGYRRYLAHLHLHLDQIRANIFAAARDYAEAVTLAENLERVDVNPIDESDWVMRLARADNLTPEQLARRLRRSVTWARERLRIARLPDDLRDAVRERQVTLGVALQIDGVADDAERRVILRTCIDNGASEQVVRQWVAAANAAHESRKLARESGEPEMPSEPIVYTVPSVSCDLCGCATDYTSSHFVRVCNDCLAVARHNLRNQ